MKALRILLAMAALALASPVCAQAVSPTNAMRVTESGRQGYFANITSGATTLVKSVPGTLHSLTINTHVASATIKLYDGITAVNIFATITEPGTITSLGPVTLLYDVPFTTGLTVVTSGNTDVTLDYQ